MSALVSAGFAFAVFLVILLDVAVHGPLNGLDRNVARRQNELALRHGPIVDAAQIVTSLGSTAVLTAVAAGAVLCWLLLRRRREAALIAVVAVFGVVVNNLVKAIVGRPRPSFLVPVAHAGGNSFPSGHAMNSTVIYGALLLMVWPRIRARWVRVLLATFAAILVVAIAWSRVALGVHYLSDVAAGAALGAAIVTSALAVSVRWRDVSPGARWRVGPIQHVDGARSSA